MSTAKVTSNAGSDQSRLNVRLSTEIKARISRAAALTGRDLTEFAVATLNEKADEVIERYENVLMNGGDYKLFLDALEDKKKPKASKKSLEAAARYRRGTRKGVRYSLAD